MPHKDQMVSVRVHKDTHKMLQEHKEKTGASIIFTIEKAVQEYFDKQNGGN